MTQSQRIRWIICIYSLLPIPGKVRIIEFQGETTVLTLVLDDNTQSEIKAVVAATERYAMDETVWLYFSPEIIHLFDGELPLLRRDT